MKIAATIKNKAEKKPKDAPNENTLLLCDVIEKEKKELLKRRKKLNQEHGTETEKNWFGIAMSGGGIRSATINMGILKTFNRFGILEKADYLSTVSGGGYCGSYVQATIRAENGNYDKLFNDKKMFALREHGEYMIPGLGIRKKWNQLLLIISYLISTIMSFISPVIVSMIIALSSVLIWSAFNSALPSVDEVRLFFDPPVSQELFSIYSVLNYVIGVLAVIVLVHFITNILSNFYLDISKYFNYLKM